MIDHLSLGVADLRRAIAFYDEVLATIGYRRLWTTDRAVGYGIGGPDEKLTLFAVGAAARPAGAGWHLALTAPSCAAVEAFHRAALEHGGADEGGPGPRPHYGAGYFAAFARDPDGHKLEAVFHGPQDANQVSDPPIALTGTIRPARQDDLGSLVELGRRSWLSAFAQTAPFALIAWWAATDRTRTLYEQSWNEMLVLEDSSGPESSGGIVGLIHLKDAEINGLWVHPAHQGRGAGTALLRSGEGRIQAAGHALAWLTCSARNHRALAFYTKRGYSEVRRDRYAHPSGIEAEDIRMERRLGTLGTADGR